ncbi:M48 family metalloprotease [Fibrella arboris]|uniref:M48 family metalloprotease n=1 Tax=Fibrella arboris TaxID=3242486 RepID=UPI0035210018
MNAAKWVSVLLFCLIPLGLLAQPQQQAGCGCALIKPTSGFGLGPQITEAEAQSLANELLKPFTNRLLIITKPFVCPGYAAMSEICAANQQKYIFYSPALITHLRNGASQGDAFVLAHELAHHLLGHTTEAFGLSGHPGARMAAGGPYQPVSYTTAGDKKTKPQVVFLSRQHLQELEADALGLWLIIKQRKVTQHDMDVIFSLLPTIINKAATPTHPSIPLRKQVIDQQWARLRNPEYLKSYLATYDRSSTEPGAYDPNNPIHIDTETAYGFALVTTDKAQLNELTALERARRDSLVRREQFSVELVGGGFFQRPVLTRNGNPVAASNGAGWLGGVRLTISPWYRRHSLETDLLLTGHSFSTLIQEADSWHILERFNTINFQLRSRYVRRLGRDDGDLQHWRRGWRLTGGLAAALPLAFTYSNNGVKPNQPPVPQASLWPVVGVGYGHSSWRHKEGHYRLWLLYQPQPLRFSTQAPDPIRATLHTISLELSGRFW